MTDSWVDELGRLLVFTCPPDYEGACSLLEQALVQAGSKPHGSLISQVLRLCRSKVELGLLWPVLDTLVARVPTLSPQLEAPPPGSAGLSVVRPPVQAAPQEQSGEDALDWTPPPIGDDMLRDFFIEVEGFLEELGPLLVELVSQDKAGLGEVYRRLHTIKGNSGMVGLTPLGTVVHRMEDLVNRVRGNEQELNDDVRSLLLEGLDAARGVTEAARIGRGTAPWRGSVARISSFMETGRIQAPPSPAPPPPPRPSEQRAAVTAGPASGPVESPAPVRPPKPQSAEAEARNRRDADSSRVVRVDYSRLDKLVNQVGEQLTSENRLAGTLARLRLGLDAARGDDEVGQTVGKVEEVYELLEQAVGDLERASGKVQSSVLGLRMVPVANLFNRHKTTVFQVARAQGKKARLVIEGGESELDKRLVEQLDDPLLHLVRNAVSHGIGTPEHRVAQGKPPEGTVFLRAFPEGNLMVIEVEDDGAGIDPEVIRRKAVDKGFLRDADAGTLERREIIALLFTPGFSTTSQVDDVSGRGVGLDVVQDRIDRLGGSVVVDSEPGRGTIFRLKLPLTLALSRALLVEVGSETVAVPLASVVQVHRMEEFPVVNAGSKPLIRVGSETIPYVNLGSFLGLDTPGPGASQTGGGTLIRVVHGERTGGLRVQAVVGQQQVMVKELGPLMGSIPHAMGVTIWADQCMLILDVASVLQEWSQGSPWLSVGVENDAGPQPASSGGGEPGLSPAFGIRRVAVYGDGALATGLEGTGVFELIPGEEPALLQGVDAVVVSHLDRDEALELVSEVREILGEVACVVLVTPELSPGDGVRGLDAGADDVWGPEVGDRERRLRLERLISIYSECALESSEEEEE